MYKTPIRQKSDLNVSKCVKGATIEEKIARIVMNKEPVANEKPLIYSDKRDGVQPAYNVKTDKWEIAAMAMDTASRAIAAQSTEGAFIETDENNEEVADESDQSA